MNVSNNTMRIGREYGYYNTVDCFRLRASILPDMYFNEDAKDMNAEIKRFERCALLVAKVAARLGITLN